MGIRTVMITGDNPLTAAAIAEEAGVDDFLAEATPEDKMALIRREQEGGRLVAMTGDGTNDAPALAQADVGVAMNTGTQAAKEAGNMVDLDSNPTKLIEVVEIGKQLLITRGSLTTFSIANDVAKYFAIIPAMFVGRVPRRSTAQHHATWIAALGDPLGGHLQRADHRGADPARPARREVPPVGGRGDAAPQPARSTASAGSIAPFIGIKLIDIVVTGPGSDHDALAQLRSPASSRLLVFTVLFGVALPARRDRRRPGRVPRPGRRLADRAQRRGRRLGLIGQPFDGAQYFQPGRRRPATATTARERGSNLGPTNPDLLDDGRASASRPTGRRTGSTRDAGAGRRRHRVRLRARPAHLGANARLQARARRREPGRSTLARC